ncbi:hypothetical protein CEXT_254111 [Caerostris extrusa]|uniref:Secreted protein n=1 Tax=Caerostris extrusa TaxID=172846 RepID=A0AAV4SMM8_CAEEX|nr:hypothetical protein CEXT_254111 [Caerostris extrusa]
MPSICAGGSVFGWGGVYLGGLTQTRMCYHTDSQCSKVKRWRTGCYPYEAAICDTFILQADDALPYTSCLLYNCPNEMSNPLSRL